VFDGSTDDHGTHVAGTIGGVGGNGKGVAGVCWSVKLMNAKFLGRNGGTTANASRRSTTSPTSRRGTASTSSPRATRWAGRRLLAGAAGRDRDATRRNILVHRRRGQQHVQLRDQFLLPGRVPERERPRRRVDHEHRRDQLVLDYGSTHDRHRRAGERHLFDRPRQLEGQVVSGYTSYSGTSMATPHVSGAAALYAAYHPGSSAATIKNAIMSSAVRRASLNGKVVSNGRLNVSGF
jgi:subtilisin family serine protease